MHVLAGVQSTAGVVLWVPIGRPDQASTTGLGQFVAQLRVSESQHLIGLKGIHYTTFNRVLNSGQLRRGVDEFMANRVDVFSHHSLGRKPKRFLKSLENLIGPRLKRLRISAHFPGDFTHKLISTVIVCTGLGAAATIVRVGIRYPCVQPVLIESI